MRSYSLFNTFFKFLSVILIFSLPAFCSNLLECERSDQSSLLLLKRSLVFLQSDLPTRFLKISSWDSNSDCCVWEGVSCSSGGRVIGLDLSNEFISGGIDHNSSLFDLHHLRRLDLSWNKFNGTLIPSGIGKLSNLLHLHLYGSGFGGQVPVEITNLTSLLTLNLSTVSYSSLESSGLKLENPTLSKLVQNLTRLTELRLDGINMSAEEQEWSRALSSSLPDLRVLSLSSCSLSAPSHISLGKLEALDLSYNNFSTAVPDFLANLSNLTFLKLSDCGLLGNIPKNITSMVLLQHLDLSYNILLSGMLPDSIGSMKSLSTLALASCALFGTITNIQWNNLRSLVDLDLHNNALSGSIPLSLFSLPSLRNLDISQNQFSGQLGEPPVVISSSTVLESIDLSRNKLEGTIPDSIFNLASLQVLYLSFNNFSGTIDLTNLFRNHGELEVLDLSFNSLSVIGSVAGSAMNSSLPRHKFLVVSLASCNVREFPDFLRDQSELRILDLSDNDIQGEIPDWIWKPKLYHLNLSHNALVGFGGSPPNLTTSLWILDLSSNLLQGQIPLPPSARYLDYSSNNFSSAIPPDIGNRLPNIAVLFLSSNDFRGSIPLSLCNISTNIGIIGDLSHNSLSGVIPPCLAATNFGVLNLRRNKLSGIIPDTFESSCLLQTLDLSENRLQGTVPESLLNCRSLTVLNLGKNELKGKFPCWLMRISSLHVLVLRSNRFHGSVECALSNARTNNLSKLQIFDIAANSFGGELPYESFKTWTAMMAQRDTAKPKPDQLGYGYYEDKVTVTTKGLTVEWEKILTIVNMIDVSCNHFQGSVPPSIGDLKSLYALNLSHNLFTGKIPSSVGNLKQLESLDLANNALTDVIPEELASLYFLSVLNLSFNQLEGKIPTSTQLQSFSEWSYIGNKGLYGPPLDTNCTNACAPGRSPLEPTSTDSDMEVDWQLICAEIGYAVGLGAVIGSLVFCKRWRLWYYEHVDELLLRFFPRLDPAKRRKRRRSQVHRW